MGVFNFWKKKKNKEEELDGRKKLSVVNQALEKVDTGNLTRMQKVALGVFKKLPKSKQEKIIQKALNPQNVQKEKGKILKQLSEAVKNGEMTKQEAEMIKSQLGLR